MQAPLIEATEQPEADTSEIAVSRRSMIRIIRRSPLAMIGGFVVLFWVLASILAPVIAPHDPINYLDVMNRLAPPSHAYPMGTDADGRDMLSRVLYGGRYSLGIGIAVVGVIGSDEHRSLQFLGDTGNIAAKLEEQSRPLDCVLVASTAALARLASPAVGANMTAVAIADREIPVAVFRQQTELQGLLASR